MLILGENPVEHFQPDQAFQSVYHDHPNLKPLVAEFAREVRDDIALIEGYCRVGGAKRVEMQVHRLRGTAATYGFSILASKLQSIERHIPNFQEDPIASQLLLDELQELYKISVEIARIYTSVPGE